MQILLGQAVMRAIAGGLSAGGSLALAHHFLSLVEPRVDPLSVLPAPAIFWLRLA